MNDMTPNKRPRRTAGDDKTRIQQAMGMQDESDATTTQGKKPRRQKRGKLRFGIIFGRMVLNGFKALIVVLCTGIIIASIVGVQVVQYVVDATEYDDSQSLLDLDFRRGNMTSFFMAPNPDNPNAVAENDYIEYQRLIGDENRIWVQYSEMPQNLINAFIATEDREFYTQHGVNIRLTIAALVNEVIPIWESQRGASTITQQLVKNLTGDGMVQEDDRTEGYQRKLREIFRAWGMHNNYSKEMILEAYLNTISLSGRLAGVEAGAQTYFGKKASELNLAECAIIAGITRAPTYYSPYQNPENCLERRDDIILFMLECEFITEAEAEAVWNDRSLHLAPRTTQSAASTGAAEGVFSYFTDKVYDDVIRDLMQQKNMSFSEARRDLYNGGYRVYLTIDLNVQQKLDELMVNAYEEGGFFRDESRFPNFMDRMTITEDITNDDGLIIGKQEVLPQMGVVVINYNGELIATSGGIGEKETSLSLNRSIGTLLRDEDGSLVLNDWGEPIVRGTLRQPGSSMKPIAAYAMGIDWGIITYSKTVMDAPVGFRNPYNPNINPETGIAQKDWPYNYGGLANVRMEKIPVFSAIAESTNTVAAQIGMWIGRERMFEFLRDTLEITSLIEPNDVDLAPLVLGATTYGMSAYEMAGAYMMFGGNDTYGRHTTLHSYTRVEDTYGNIVLQPDIVTVQAINPQSGYVMNRLLRNVLISGNYPAGSRPAAATAGGMALEGEMPSAGKTGTTDDDTDRWFMGLTPYYVTAVWWGYDRDHTMLLEGGKGWAAGGRQNPPINMWKVLMESVQADYEVIDFPAAPEGVTERAFCTISGGAPVEGCPTMTGYYTDFALPEMCPGHGEPHEPPAV